MFVTLYILQDKNNGLSKQYGFVEMNTVEEVEKILATKSFYIANGKVRKKRDL